MKNQRKMVRFKMDMFRVAIKALKNGLTPDNKAITYLVIGEYSRLIMRMKLAKNKQASRDYIRKEGELQNKAFQAERDEIQNLFEKGKVTIDVTRKIRRQINIREAYWMEGK